MPTTWLTDIQKIRIIWNQCTNVSKKFQKDTSLRTGDIPLSNFGKEVSKKQTDRHTLNLESFVAYVPTSQEYLQKNQKDVSSRIWKIPIFVYFPLGSKPTNRLTDIQEIQNYSEIVYQHPRNVSKKIQWDISSRTGVIPIFV